MKRTIAVSLFVSLFFLGAFAGTRESSGAAEEPEIQQCLKCHAQEGIIKKFENRESVSAYINGDNFRASVHGGLNCSECHTEFSEGRHPERSFKSKKQYRIRTCLPCRRCHSGDQLAAPPAHAGLLRDEEKGKPIICSDCHGIHTITAVRGGKKFQNERQYCLSCHGKEVHLSFKNGERMLIKIAPQDLQSSVHSMLSCSDCHYGFSSEDHPKRNFRSRRDYSIAAAETCRRCHFDKYTKTLDSMHYTVLSQGNFSSPVCTDCHGSHAITHSEKGRIAIAQRCQKCHREVYDLYVQSVHGSALLNEQNRDVPVCTDCHSTHNITDPRTLAYHERIPELCGNCHRNKEIMAKYGLSTDVVKSYLTDFHGVTLGFYKKQKEVLHMPGKEVAVCTDCHGIHTIARISGSNAASIRANVAKKCQGCHSNADKDFPDAWLPHYEPSLKKAPLVYIVNTLYKVLLPAMVIGLILQIALHIWRYAINR